MHKKINGTGDPIMPANIAINAKQTGRIAIIGGNNSNRIRQNLSGAVSPLLFDDGR